MSQQKGFGGLLSQQKDLGVLLSQQKKGEVFAGWLPVGCGFLLRTLVLSQFIESKVRFRFLSGY